MRAPAPTLSPQLPHPNPTSLGRGLSKKHKQTHPHNHKHQQKSNRICLNRAQGVAAPPSSAPRSFNPADYEKSLTLVARLLVLALMRYDTRCMVRGACHVTHGTRHMSHEGCAVTRLGSRPSGDRPAECLLFRPQRSQSAVACATSKSHEWREHPPGPYAIRLRMARINSSFGVRGRGRGRKRAAAAIIRRRALQAGRSAV